MQQIPFSGVDGTGLARFAASVSLPPALTTVQNLQQSCALSTADFQSVLQDFAKIARQCQDEIPAGDKRAVPYCIVLEELASNPEIYKCGINLVTANDLTLSLSAVTYRYDLSLGSFDPSQDIAFGVLTQNLVTAAPDGA